MTKETCVRIHNLCTLRGGKKGPGDIPLSRSDGGDARMLHLSHGVKGCKTLQAPHVKPRFLPEKSRTNGSWRGRPANELQFSACLARFGEVIKDLLDGRKEEGICHPIQSS